MDEKLLESLKSFEKVWKRVSGGSSLEAAEPEFKLMPRKNRQGMALRFAPFIK